MMRNERGNILFLILLAVVLFAALSYAVTSSVRGGGNDASKESADMVAANIIQIAGLMEQTITRAKLMDNIQDWGFDFYRGQSGGNLGTNATCTAAACKIFSENGGNIPFYILPDNYMMTGATTNQRNPTVYVAKVVEVGSDANDVILVYENISAELCDAFNRVLKNTSLNKDSPVDGIGGTNTSYSGTLTALPASTGVLGDANTGIKGKKAACVAANNSPYYYRFYYTIMER